MQRHCPNCGAPLKPHAKYCDNCGYQLRVDPVRLPKSKKKHYIITMWAIVSPIIILLVLGIIGFIKLESTPPSNSNTNNQNQTESTNNGSTISKEMASNMISHVFQDAQDKINNGYQNSMSSYFQDGTNNDSYKQLESWADDEENNSNLRTVSMTPSDISISSNGVKYQVNYTFKHTDGSKHHQGFTWFARMQKTNGTWEIVSNKASSNPNYDD